MPQVRGTVTVIYSCALLTLGVILAFMAYAGVFDGFWSGLFDTLERRLEIPHRLMLDRLLDVLALLAHARRNSKSHRRGWFRSNGAIPMGSSRPEPPFSRREGSRA